MRMSQQELTCKTPLLPRKSGVMMRADGSPALPVCNFWPAATYIVLALLVAIEVRVWPSVSAEETCVPLTTWYFKRLARTACREMNQCLVLTRY